MLMWIVFILLGYLIGSIPFGYLIGRARGIDIRQHGSLNIGATNIGRVLGRWFGLTCFTLDFFKGALPVIAAGWFMGTLGEPADELAQAQMWLWLAVVAGTVLGHVFSIFLGLRGGKGVATAFGALVGMWPLLTIPALFAVLIWGFTVLIGRIVALASIVAAVSLPLAVVVAQVVQSEEDPLARLLHATPLLIVTLLLAALVVVRHRTNIVRIIRGNEPRLREKVVEEPAA